jgi:hypothetical protein
MKQESKQRSQEQQQLSHSQQSTAREFATAEELLRHDAAQTQVPPVIAERLTQSIAKLPGQPKSWWQRWLKR